MIELVDGMQHGIGSWRSFDGRLLVDVGLFLFLVVFEFEGFVGLLLLFEVVFQQFDIVPVFLYSLGRVSDHALHLNYNLSLLRNQNRAIIGQQQLKHMHVVR